MQRAEQGRVTQMNTSSKTRRNSCADEEVRSIVIGERTKSSCNGVTAEGGTSPRVSDLQASWITSCLPVNGPPAAIPNGDCPTSNHYTIQFVNRMGSPAPARG